MKKGKLKIISDSKLTLAKWNPHVPLLTITFVKQIDELPLPPLNIQIPPSLPSWILLLRRVGLLSVLIHTPAMALSKISLSSIKPRPETHSCILSWEKQRREPLPWKSNSWLTRTRADASWYLTWVVNQNASILSSPDLVPPDLRIAASPVKERTQEGALIHCFTNATCNSFLEQLTSLQQSSHQNNRFCITFNLQHT